MNGIRDSWKVEVMNQADGKLNHVQPRGAVRLLNSGLKSALSAGRSQIDIADAVRGLGVLLHCDAVVNRKRGQHQTWFEGFDPGTKTRSPRNIASPEACKPELCS